jgi:hypothetical protein
MQSAHGGNDFAVGDIDTYNICNHYRFTLSRAIAPTARSSVCPEEKLQDAAGGSARWRD